MDMARRIFEVITRRRSKRRINWQTSDLSLLWRHCRQCLKKRERENSNASDDECAWLQEEYKGFLSTKKPCFSLQQQQLGSNQLPR